MADSKTLGQHTAEGQKAQVVLELALVHKLSTIADYEKRTNRCGRLISFNNGSF